MFAKSAFAVGTYLTCLLAAPTLIPGEAMAGGTSMLNEMVWDLHDDEIVDAMLVAPARIEISAEPAENANGPTAALTVAYGVGPDLAEQYGGTIRNAMVIVAIDLETANIYANSPVNVHAVPLSATMLPQPSELPEATADGDLVSAARIGIDLSRTLSLPPKASRYAVFVWLDRLVSNTIIIETGDATPREGKVATPLNEWPAPLGRVVIPTATPLNPDS